MTEESDDEDGVQWWEQLLIRENSKPGAIAIAKPKKSEKPGRKAFDNTIISLAEVFSNTVKEIQEGKRVSNTNIREKINEGVLDKENIPRIAQALKDKLQNLSTVIMLNELREGIENLAKDPRTMSELTPILDEGYRKIKGSERKKFIDMLNLDVDREELMDSLYALMRTGGMDYSTYINDIIAIAPEITRKDIMVHAKSKGEEIVPTRVRREYEIVPYNNFSEVMKGDHTSLEKFKNLVQNVYTAWNLRDNNFKFYIEHRVSGATYGTPTKDRPVAQETTVASPLFILYKILKYQKDRNIFTTSDYGALLGRREQIGRGKRANMIRLFAQDRVKRLGGNLREIIDNAKKEVREPGSLRPEFNEWMASTDNPFSQGDYARSTTAGDLGSMLSNLFSSSIDLRAIYVAAFPTEGGVNLGDSILADIENFPEITGVAKPVELLKSYLHVINNFNKEAVAPLMDKLNEITRELLLLKYYDEIEEEEVEIFIERDDGSIDFDATLTELDQPKVVAAVDDFNNELRKALEQTSENIIRTLYDMIKNNLNTDGVGKYSLSSSVKAIERIPDKKRLSDEDIARIKEREDDPSRRIRGRKPYKQKDRGTIQQYIYQYAKEGADFNENQKLIDFKF